MSFIALKMLFGDQANYRHRHRSDFCVAADHPAIGHFCRDDDANF